jgi:predicted signal transduction protein with EAL and GGDEF domain
VGLALVDVVRDRIILPREVRRAALDDADPHFTLRNVPGFLTFCVIWGSLPVLAAVGGEPEALWLTTIVVLAVLSMYTVTTAASRPLFAVGLAGMLGPTSLAMIIEGAAATRLGLLAIAYAGIAAAVHDSLHRSLLDAVRTQQENGALAAQLQQFLSDRDPRTGLLNRQSFIAGVDALLGGEGTENDVILAVGNVRRFAALNELHGEHAGDALIAEIGARLQATPESPVLLARLDGDEFAIAAAAHAAVDIDPALALEQVSAEPLDLDGVKLYFDLHIARLARGPDHNSGADLVADALSTMRVLRARAKQVPTNAGSVSISERRRLIEELSGGIAAAGVRPWFQPIVAAETRGLTGWEALVRWEHPERGLITPDRLLPLVATAGLEDELLEVVVDGALRFVGELDAIGATGHTMHVNLTPGDLRQRGTVDLLLSLLFDHRISAGRLVVEVTEQDILHLDDSVRSTLLRLDASGVHLAVDDFGTGFSSLSHLLDLPTDHLKIDRRFVAGMIEDSEASMLVRGILGLANGMRLHTVAEGVETDAHARLLAEMGCTHLQGYLISPALPTAKAVAFASAYQATQAQA